MCHKLHQVYHCGHYKEVCITRCDYAIKNEHHPASPHPMQLGVSQQLQDVGLTRKGSGASIAAELVPTGRSSANSFSTDRDTVASQQQYASSTAEHPADSLRLTLSLSRGQLTGQLQPSSLRHSCSHSSHASATSPAYPSSSPSTSENSSSLASPSSPPIADIDQPEQIPKFCIYIFARFLPPSKHPCFDCYMRPKYAQLRNRWMQAYMDGHPLLKEEDVFEQSGIGWVRRAQGLSESEKERLTEREKESKGRGE